MQRISSTSVSVCMHVCMYVCMYVCICMHVCMSMYLYLCTYVCDYVSSIKRYALACQSVLRCTCVYMRVYVCTCACRCVCRCVCMCTVPSIPPHPDCSVHRMNRLSYSFELIVISFMPIKPKRLCMSWLMQISYFGTVLLQLLK